MTARVPRVVLVVRSDALRDLPFGLTELLCLRSCLETLAPERIELHCAAAPTGPYWAEIAERITIVSHEALPDARATPGYGLHRPIPVWKREILERLVESGGIHVELDTLFLEPLPAALFERDFVLAELPAGADPLTGVPMPRVGTGFVLCAPDAPFARRWLAAGGPGEASAERLAGEHPDEVLVLPAPAVHPIEPSARGLSELFDQCRLELLAGAHAVRLWMPLWQREQILLGTFEASCVTEEALHATATTFHLAARRYAPSASPARARRRRARIAATRLARRAAREVVGLLRLLVHGLLRRILSDDAERALRARREWAFLGLTRRLRLRNDFEAAIVSAITHEDEYGVVDRRFAAGDAIVDVGAHVGAFSSLCHRRGSRRIRAFEPDPASFAMLRANLSGRRGVRLDRRAVFRSDTAGRAVRLRLSGSVHRNTGAVNVVFGGRSLGVGTQEAWDDPRHPTEPVETIALDDVLRDLGRVTLLKLDCEGSEFPILLTSAELDRVDEIVGEYHEILPPLAERLDPNARVGDAAYRIETLVARLEESGFRVSWTPTGPHLGRFRAVAGRDARR